jgi:choloylglycine hydrolase
MKQITTILVLLPTLGLSWRPSAEACTNFAIVRGGKAVAVGKSYDFQAGDGLLMVNKRGVAKQALLIPGTPATPARWTARYGSVTFNQYGREFPVGGINEKGLVVEVMWLNQTRHGKLDRAKPTLNELQWVQHLLDTSASVKEAIQLARRLQVAKAYAPVHYMACDRSGSCATLEYLAGKLVTHSGKKLPFPVLTNSTYAASLARARQHKTLGGKRPTPGSESSLDRFVRAATLARGYRTGDVVSYAFSLLDKVRIRDLSQWQIVYEPGKGKIHFRNAGKQRHHTVDATAQDYSCTTAVRFIDLRGTVVARGKKAKGKKPWVFNNYKLEHNLKLLRLSLAALKNPFPQQAVRMFAAYPEMACRCVVPPQGAAAPK